MIISSLATSRASERSADSMKRSDRESTFSTATSPSVTRRRRRLRLVLTSRFHAPSGRRESSSRAAATSRAESSAAETSRTAALISSLFDLSSITPQATSSSNDRRSAEPEILSARAVAIASIMASVSASDLRGPSRNWRSSHSSVPNLLNGGLTARSYRRSRSGPGSARPR